MLPSGLSIPAALILAAELLCYFFYPIWGHFSPGRYTPFALGLGHLAGLLFLLCLWQRVIPVQPSASGIGGSKSSISVTPIAFLLFVFAVLQWPFLVLPLVTGPDEPVQVTNHFLQWKLLARSPLSSALLLLSVVLLWLVCYIFFHRWKEARAPTRVAAIALATFALYGVVLQFADPNWGASIRWPPLGLLVSGFSHTVLGVSEPAVRFPALFFYLATGFVLYRLLYCEYGREAALVGTLLCLSMPIFFRYGHFAYRETGGVFFLTLGAFYLARYWRSDISGLYIGTAIAAAILGYLERRPAVGLVFVVGAVVLIKLAVQKTGATRTSRDWEPLLSYTLGVAVTAWVAYPWSKITQGIRPFGFSFANWQDWTLVSAYPKILPDTIGLPATVLLVAGLVLAFTKKPRGLSILALSWLIVFFAIFVSDIPRHIPVPRFVILVAPAIAILCTGVWHTAITRLPIRPRIGALLTVPVFLAPLLVWYTGKPLGLPVPKHVRSFTQEPYYPDDELARYLAEQPPTNLVFPIAWQYALPAYLRLWNIKHVNIHIPPWTHPLTTRVSVHEVRKLCAASVCDYAVFHLKKRDGWRLAFVSGVDPDNLIDNQTSGLHVHKLFLRDHHGLALVRFNQ